MISVVSEQEYENLCLKSISILNRLYKTTAFINEGNYEEREKKYEERSNPLPEFIEEACDEDMGEVVKLQEFSKQFNIWIKDKRLKPVSIIQVGKMLRNEGYQVGSRKKDNENFVGILNMSFKAKNIVQPDQPTTDEEKYYADQADQEALV
ncbi:MAG: hypothetical protein Q8N55_02560 [bacterium]|nr:hypothetical protein [bacterium]